jgi:hypothetical protein
MTEHEQQATAAGRKGWSTGFQEGFRAGTESGNTRVAQLEARLRELEQDAITDVDRISGDQIVEVDGYAYRWAGTPPLVIGDHVLLPESWLSNLNGDIGPREGTVTALGPAYRGELKKIVRKIADA